MNSKYSAQRLTQAGTVTLLTVCFLAGAAGVVLDQPFFRLSRSLAALPSLLAGGLVGAAVGLAISPSLVSLPLLLLGLLLAAPLTGKPLVTGPWHFAVLAGSIAAALVCLKRMMEQSEQEGVVRGALTGVVGEAVIRQVVDHPEVMQGGDRGASISCMSIDLVGFQTMVTAYPPNVVFPCLRALQQMVTDVAHRYGGVVDRNFRDGFSCFFGGQMLRDGPVGMHAEAAIRCAIEIQRRNILLILDAVAKQHPVFPLRIGVETALTSVGSLQSDATSHPIVVGELVSDAAHFRSVCNVHSVVLSRRVFDLLSAQARTQFPFAVKSLVKPGRTEQTRIYELDALYEQGGFRETAVEALRKCADLKRLNNRWPVKNRALVQVMTPAGLGTIHDISRGGVALALPQPMSERKEFQATIVTYDPLLRTRLEYRGVLEIAAEVRWSKPLSEGRLHGVQWLTMSDDTKDFFLQCILEAHSGYSD